MFEELRSRIDEAFRNSPAQDIEKNLRALLSSWFERLDLVLREDFEVQKKLLERANEGPAADNITLVLVRFDAVDSAAGNSSTAG